MSQTGISTSHALAVKKWADDAYEAFLDQLVLAPYMGTDSNALIHVREDLVKGAGDQLTIGLVGALSGDGVQGDSVLEGSEEALSSYGLAITINQFRNGVRTTGRLSDQRYPFQIRDYLRPELLRWAQQKMENDAFLAMGSIDGTNYSAAAEADKDSWLAHNADRVLFGAAVSNNSSNDHSASLLNVDSSNDVLNPAQITLAKRLAQLANPKIRPLRIEGGEEVYVLFAHPYCTRDLKASSDWKNAQYYSAPRSEDNRIFTGAIGRYDNVIIVESPKVPLYYQVGASTSNVAQNFLCGAQAVGMVQGGIGGSRMDFVEQEFDYENQVGVAVAMMYGMAKSRFKTGSSATYKDHGIVTVYSSAVAD